MHRFAPETLMTDDGQPAAVARMETVMNRDLRLWMGSM
jgi:hypothetical protein